MPETGPDRPKAPDEARKGKDSRWRPQARSMWTHLEKALLLKLIREHEVATANRARVAQVDPHHLCEGCKIQIADVTTA